MLRIIQNQAAESAKNYYSHGDYLSEGQEQNGKWGGSGAVRLGLSGEVTKAAFDRLCDNQHPQTGEQLTPRTRSDRTVGYDFNFHVPKKVSIAYALNQDENILHAFEQSVDETMLEIEQDAKTRIRTGRLNSERDTKNLTWATFIHHTARPVGGIPDMHLHAHCFVFNQTFDADENRWKAGQFRDIKRDAPYFEAAFHARFAQRLAELGYQIERHGRQWDIAGIDDRVKQVFSRRGQLIDELAADEGIVTDKEKDALAAKTREAKQTSHSMDELREIWNSWLSDDDQNLLAKVKQRPLPRNEKISVDDAIEHARTHCFERSSVVPLRSLAAEALRRGLGSVGVEETLRGFDRHDIIRREWRGRMMATTPEVQAEEARIVEFARSGKNTCRPLNDQWQIRRDWLNHEQRSAIEHLLRSKDRVMLLRGGAGTGKTSLMTEAVEAMEAGSHHVLTFAPSAEASRGVLQSEGFDGATTVAELLVNSELQQAARGQVIWIDEAGLLGTKDMRRVIELADELNARLILSGDVRQHGPVQRGAGMRLLEEQAGLKMCETNAIQRQKAAYRDAIAAISLGDVEQGFRRLDELGWVHAVSGEERLQRIAECYMDSLRKKWQTLVVSPTHAEAKQVTAEIRSQLRQQNLIGAKDHDVTSLRPKHLTLAERQDQANYSDGDVIVFQQNAKGFRKGDRLVFHGQLDDRIVQQAERFAVFHPETIKLAARDQIRITANGTTKDGKHRLNNGAMYTIGGFTPDGDKKLTNGWIVDRDFGHVTYGYVTTSHASQGRTVDHVILAESQASFPAAGSEQFYVSTSRGRKKATIFTDDKDGLMDAVSQCRTELSASELTGAKLHHNRQQASILNEWNNIRRIPAPTRSFAHAH